MVAHDSDVAISNPRTPALVFGLTPRPLTAREREITAMAAQGLSSRSIAEHLVLSVRTIDNHLQRAYDKLGVRSRDELSTVLGQLGEADTDQTPR